MTGSRRVGCVWAVVAEEATGTGWILIGEGVFYSIGVEHFS